MLEIRESIDLLEVLRDGRWRAAHIGPVVFGVYQDDVLLADFARREDAELFVRAKKLAKVYKELGPECVAALNPAGWVTQPHITQIDGEAWDKEAMKVLEEPSPELQGIEWWLPPEPDHVLDKEG